MSTSEHMAGIRRAWKEQRDFFSPAGQKRQERWIVREFLALQDIPFSESELESVEVDSPIDLKFREARFQVKELVDPHCRRGDEIKAYHEQAKTAKQPGEVLGLSRTYPIPPVESGAKFLLEQTRKIGPKYEATKQRLDLLFYVTRTRVSPVQRDELKQSQLSELGWRSISYVGGNYSAVLFADPEGPSFLVDRAFFVPSL